MIIISSYFSFMYVVLLIFCCMCFCLFFFHALLFSYLFHLSLISFHQMYIVFLILLFAAKEKRWVIFKGEDDPTSIPGQ